MKKAKICLHYEEIPRAEDPPDYLKKLYPHALDDDCYMDERSHKYYVHGKPYLYSVSGVWEVFFERFDGESISSSCIDKAKKGVCNEEMSLYNLASLFSFVEKLDPNSGRWDERTREVLGDVYTPEKLQSLRGYASGKGKPAGCACYHYAWRTGLDVDVLQGMWKINGDTEAFKGTIMHKRAELFLQSLARWQYERNRHYVPVGELLNNTQVYEAAFQDASVYNALQALVHIFPKEFWDHPVIQRYMTSEMERGTSLEFDGIIDWMRRRPTLTPYRTEWSIYDDKAQIAGQIDSLWYDTEKGKAVVMADWKRVKEILTPDRKAQEKSSRKRGLSAHPRSEYLGPMHAFVDCPYNHYHAQQNIYCSILQNKYDIDLSELWLIQSHPHASQGTEVRVKKDADLVDKLIEAFWGGWHPGSSRIRQEQKDGTEV